MKLFKYRPGADCFQRDLDTIKRNQFWSSPVNQLNDPCETLTDNTRIKKLQHWIARKMNIATEENLEFLNQNADEVLSLSDKMGIFSLSNTHLDELLWAHYGNSHKGFCIEYDLNKIVETDGEKAIYSRSVKYRNKPPKLWFTDALRTSYDKLVEKYGFYKSKRWGYEKEYRIVTSKIGLNSHQLGAIKSIYFGLKMADKEKDRMISELAGRGINFFQIRLTPNSYTFTATRLDAFSDVENKYLREIPESISKSTIRTKIIKHKIYNYGGVSEIKVQIEKRIDNLVLEKFSKYLKDNLMPDGKAIFISYYLKGQNTNELEWAVGNFTQSKWNFEICQS
jgi:hypothetical protein